MTEDTIPNTHYDSTALETINFIIENYKFNSYLELGCRADATFSKIRCDKKVGVDNARGGTLHMTTDQYFEKYSDKFDVIFVDADHRHPQVMKDVTNALNALNENGFIVMHDCYPYSTKYENLNGKASGTVWRTFVHLRQNPQLDMIVSNYDHGVGVIRRGKNNHLLSNLKSMDELSYQDFVHNHEKWMSFQSWEEVQKWILSSKDID
jgi:hypothetical protein